jgi:hypothetical protein
MPARRACRVPLRWKVPGGRGDGSGGEDGQAFVFGEGAVGQGLVDLPEFEEPEVVVAVVEVAGDAEEAGLEEGGSEDVQVCAEAVHHADGLLQFFGAVEGGGGDGVVEHFAEAGSGECGGDLFA